MSFMEPGHGEGVGITPEQEHQAFADALLLDKLDGVKADLRPAIRVDAPEMLGDRNFRYVPMHGFHDLVHDACAARGMECLPRVAVSDSALTLTATLRDRETGHEMLLRTEQPLGAYGNNREFSQCLLTARRLGLYKMFDIDSPASAEDGVRPSAAA